MYTAFVRYWELNYTLFPSAAETEQRQTVSGRIVGQLRFDLIRTDATLTSVEFYFRSREYKKTVTMILSKSANPISSPGDVIDLVETQICYVIFTER